jgi:hypothetical protein
MSEKVGFVSILRKMLRKIAKYLLNNALLNLASTSKNFFADQRKSLHKQLSDASFRNWSRRNTAFDGLAMRVNFLLTALSRAALRGLPRSPAAPLPQKGRGRGHKDHLEKNTGVGLSFVCLLHTNTKKS